MSLDEFDPLAGPTKNAHLHPVAARSGVEIESVNWQFQPVPPSSARGRLSFSADVSTDSKSFSRPASSSTSQQEGVAATAQTATERRRNTRSNATPTHKKTLSNTLKDASATLAAKQAKSTPASSTSSSSSQTSVTVSAKSGTVIITAPPKTQNPQRNGNDDDDDDDDDDEEDDDDDDDDEDDDDGEDDEDDEDEDDKKSKASSKSPAALSKTGSSAALSKQCAVAGCTAKRTTRGYCAQHAANPTAPVAKAVGALSLNDKPITDRRADQWSFNQIHSSTSLGLNKNCLEWMIVDKGVSHKIELFHSTVGGKRIIKINGATKLNEKRPMESGSRYDIRIGPKGQTTIGIEVRPSGLVGFSYELFVNGRAYDEAKRYWLKHSDA